MALRVRFVAFVASTVCATVTLVLSCLPGLELPAPPPACGSNGVDLDDGAACDPGDAGLVGCSATCQIVCEGGVVDDTTNHCYFWTPPVLSLDMSGMTCANLNAHPVSFVDLNELMFVASGTKGLPNAASGSSWLALEKGFPNDAGFATYYTTLADPLPGWAASCVGCFAYTDAADLALPTSGQPQNCAEWKHTLTTSWEQTGCTQGVTDAGVQNVTTVLCEREPPGSFSAPCTSDASAGNTCIEVPYTHTTKRYELAGLPASFALAQTTCVASGGSLVHFETGAEREEVVAEVVRSTATSDIWIGLTFDVDAGAWAWVDGTAAPYAFPTPWADLEPSMTVGSAAAIHIEKGSFSTRLARAEDATTVLPYICEFAK